MPESGNAIAEPPSASAARPAPARTIAKPKLLPQFRVLLHNDDVNEFGFVAQTVCRLTPLSLEEAVIRTIEAHDAGIALLLITHKERAELYADQFATFKLTVTIEPVE